MLALEVPRRGRGGHPEAPLFWHGLSFMVSSMMSLLDIVSELLCQPGRLDLVVFASPHG